MELKQNWLKASVQFSENLASDPLAFSKNLAIDRSALHIPNQYYSSYVSA
jgi:hypothetical protein